MASVPQTSAPAAVAQSGTAAAPDATSFLPRPELSSGPDPLVAALAGAHPNQNPFGVVVNPQMGAVSRQRFVPSSDPFAPSKPTLEPVSPGEKQAYLEWLVGASANYAPGVMSPEEGAARQMLHAGLLPGQPDWAKLTAPDAPEKGLLDFIAQAEGADDDTARRHHFASGYDVPYFYGQYGMPAKPVSQMTLGEIDAYQTRIRDRFGLKAVPVGRYQFLQSTLRELKQHLGLSDNDVLTPELQDRLGRELLRINGVNQYRAGRVSGDRFQDNLAGTWDSLPETATGLSHTRKPVRVTKNQVQAALGPLAPR